MPDPAANATSVRVAPGSIGTPKRPSGVITDSVSPTRGCSLAQLENAPPASRLMATRSSPSSRPEQIEYDRRTSSPSMVVRSVRYWPGT